MEDWYQNEALRLIGRAESRKQDTLEVFYRGLARACNELLERLEVASEELSPDRAAEVRRILNV